MRSRFYECIFLLCLFAFPGLAQNPAPPQQHPTHPGDIGLPPANGDDTREQLEHDLAKKAAKERVAALKTDTDKLLKLSVELKQYVDKSDENVLSLDVIKKADEIEKLAKSVKDKMKGPN
ncbi:MAG: hypothetical protein ACLQBK_13285 [Candidatus Sulfotelmatobacter sp.]